MRVVFFGYSQTGAVALEVLRAQGHEVTAVVTHEDDPREDRWYRTPAEVAAPLGISIRYDHELEAPGVLRRFVREQRADLLLSVFYRRMIPTRVLAEARLAMNLHPSLLPAYRGRAPINWVLVNGERETGVTLHHMIATADAGDMVAQRAIAIDPRETALTLYGKVEAASRALLEETLPLIATGHAPRTPQDHSRATTFGRRGPEDGRIDWSWSAARIDRLVRAVAPPWPGAFGALDGQRTAIYEGAPDAGPGAPSRPGEVRRDGNSLLVGTGDGWFRVDRWARPDAAEGRTT